MTRHFRKARRRGASIAPAWSLPRRSRRLPWCWCGTRATAGHHDVRHGARGDAGRHRHRARPARDRQSGRRACAAICRRARAPTPRRCWLILGGLALLIAIIGFGGGFILGDSALFVTTSAAFGRRALLADTAIALVMTTLIYLAFDRLLTLSLPAGPLERLL